MILDKEIEVKISKKNINHYQQFFSNIQLKDLIKINTSIHLQKGSNLKINVQCDICNIQRYIKYQAYTKNINSCPEYSIYTCDKCSHLKIKEYNKKKYGVEYFSQTDEYNKKFKSTMIERYGVEHALQSQEIKEKVKKTNLEKFGVENPFENKNRIQSVFQEKYGFKHPSQVKDFNDKIKQSNLVSTGYKSPLSSPEIREQIKKKNIERYGVDHHMKLDSFKEKVEKTNKERYGVDWVLQSIDIRESIKQKSIKKWGVDNPTKSEEVRKKSTIIGKDPNYIKYNGNNYSTLLCDKGHFFDINIDNYHSRLKGNIPFCTVCNPIGSHSSIKELELFGFIALNYNSEIIKSYRDELEIDIYIPGLKIGFEFNGLYWHSNEYKEKQYHLNKTNHFKNKGIRIIHIWEDDWDLKTDIIKSQIKNWLGLTENKIYARKCQVKEVTDIKIVREFLDSNHIQGFVNSSKKYGLFYNNELVSLMIFDHFEGRNRMTDNEWNLSRFCNKINTNVVGGASKLFKFFINTNNPKRVISYADKDWSNGSLYYNLGFNNIYDTNVDYKYLIENKRTHKSKYRKSKLKTNLSESTYMKEIGIPKIYDCGKSKFEIRYN